MLPKGIYMDTTIKKRRIGASRTMELILYEFGGTIGEVVKEIERIANQEAST